MDLPFPDITEDDLEFLELDVSAFDSTGGDQLWRPNRLLFMFNVVAAACGGSSDLTVSTWLRLIEGDAEEDLMALWVDGDEDLKWELLEYGPLQAHWKAAQDALRARYQRVSAEGGAALTRTEKVGKIRTAEDRCLRAAAISWLMLTSRAMEYVDAERGLRKRSVFRLGELIKIWDALPLSRDAEKYPGSITAPERTLAEFSSAMDEAGHTCHCVLGEQLLYWLPLVGWLEGIPRHGPINLGSPLCRCIGLSFHDRPDIDDASTSLRPNADHPLQNGSVWPAFLVAVVVADAAPSLSSYYASARHRVLDLLSCIIPLTCARIPPSQWNNIDQTLRHRLMVDKADVSYHDWVNQYPSAWRPAITLLSHQEWQYIEELHNKYTRAPATPWERDRLGRKCATYLQASCHFLHDRWDDRAALGENYDVETLLFSVLWLVEDYRYCRRAFRLRWRPVDMYNDWGAACKTLVLAFRDFPAERSAERSMTCLLQVMERHGHVCRAYGGAMVREMFGGVIGFLGHVTARELVVFQDVVATQKPIPDTLYVPSFLVEPMRCSLCTWTNNDSWAILPVAFGQELCTKLSVLHVRMQFAETRDDFMSVLNIGIEAGDALTAYADSALEACPPVLTEQILRTWISLLYLIFESRTFKSEPDEVLGEMENLLNSCRDRLVERATYGAELPTSSPVEFMELLQNLLDDSKDYHDILVPSGRTQCVLDPPFRKALHRLLMKLGEETKALLPSIFMRNVEFSGNAPVTGGGFADVYKGHVGDMVVALKRIRMYETNDIEKLNKLFQREALVWRQLRHPHILPFLGMHPSPNSNPYLVSPWMERGNMMTCRRQNMFLEADIHRLLDEIAQGLFYLHSENIVHGDICGRNILIDDQGHARLADFGLSVLAEATKGAYTESHSTGSERWQPAELLDFTRTSFRKTRETDVYAFGCVCLELCTGKKPYSYIPNGSFAYAVIRGQKPKRPAPEEAVGLRDDFWDLMQKCWEKEPQDRVPWQWLSNWVSNIRRSGRPGMMGYGASR